MPNIEMVGLEPTTSALSKRCSNLLSYTSVMAGPMGLEPTIYGSTNRCFNQLSYNPLSIATENRTPITWMKTKCPNR